MANEAVTLPEPDEGTYEGWYTIRGYGVVHRGADRTVWHAFKWLLDYLEGPDGKAINFPDPHAALAALVAAAGEGSTDAR